MMHRIAGIFLKPFKEHFLFLIIFFVLATSPCILYQFYVVQAPINNILVAIHCFVLSYLITIVIGLIHNALIRRIVQAIVIAVFAVDFALNIYCIFELGYMFDADFAKLILDTNTNEAQEFVSTMLPMRTVLVVLGVFFALILLGILSTKRKLNLGKRSAKYALCLLCLCAIENIYSWGIWHDGPINRLMELPEYEVPGNLKEYYVNPTITFFEDGQTPTNVVLIIGESYARCHSSLYGYEKDTNPKLNDLKLASVLYAFDSIDAPAPSTAQSVKYMISTFNRNDTIASKKWYEYTSLIEVMQKSGYNCFWFSNQARGSKNNGVSRAFAELCQQQWFLQKEGSAKKDAEKLYDIVLVDSSYQHVNQLIASSKNHNFIVYHMMGSHFNFGMRYPQEYSIFSEQDYTDHPESHREVLATYDNSILYNDYIVEQIINLFKDKDAIVVYLPDHGQVIYRDKRFPDYFAHGRENDSISYAYGVEIPFFVYVSPSFQEKSPDLMRRIKNRQDNPKEWNSDDLPYFIMDLIGIKEINGEDVRLKSVL